MVSGRNNNFSGRVPLSRQNSGKKESKKKASSSIGISKPIIFVLGFLLVLVGIFGILHNPSSSKGTETSWKVSDQGTLSFSERDKPLFTSQDIKDVYAPESSDTLKLISFDSNGEKIRALFRIPANSYSPGIVLLPGAGVSKEAEQGLAVELSKMGYATITLDQRNLGSINLEKDLDLFKAGLEPVEYSMIRPAAVSTNGDRGNDMYAEKGAYDPGKYIERYRGIASRIILYTATRYWADGLKLTENVSDAPSNKTMGKLSELLKWNLQYPVDITETHRNNIIYGDYNVRNVFIDHPEAACKIWGSFDSETAGVCKIS